MSEMILEKGKIYKFNHSRKGEFSGRVLKQSAEWVDVEVTDGYAGAMLDYNVAHKGEDVIMRKSHIRSAIIQN